MKRLQLGATAVRPASLAVLGHDERKYRISVERGKLLAPPHRAVTRRSSLLTLVHAPRSRSSRFLWLLEEIGEPYDARIAAQSYIAGETFTAADVLYAGAFALFMDSPLLGEKKTKALEDYVARCVSRPARAWAAAKDQYPV
jgi:hypothetical protein